MKNNIKFQNETLFSNKSKRKDIFPYQKTMASTGMDFDRFIKEEASQSKKGTDKREVAATSWTKKRGALSNIYDTDNDKPKRSFTLTGEVKEENIKRGNKKYTPILAPVTLKSAIDKWEKASSLEGAALSTYWKDVKDKSSHITKDSIFVPYLMHTDIYNIAKANYFKSRPLNVDGYISVYIYGSLDDVVTTLVTKKVIPDIKDNFDIAQWILDRSITSNNYKNNDKQTLISDINTFQNVLKFFLPREDVNRIYNVSNALGNNKIDANVVDKNDFPLSQTKGFPDQVNLVKNRSPINVFTNKLLAHITDTDTVMSPEEWDSKKIIINISKIANPTKEVKITTIESDSDSSRRNAFHFTAEPLYFTYKGKQYKLGDKLYSNNVDAITVFFVELHSVNSKTSNPIRYINDTGDVALLDMKSAIDSYQRVAFGTQTVRVTKQKDSAIIESDFL